MRGIRLPKLSSTNILTGIAALAVVLAPPFYSFGPVILDWLLPRPQPPTAHIEQSLKQNQEVLEALTRTLDRMDKDSERNPGDGESGQDDPKIPGVVASQPSKEAEKPVSTAPIPAEPQLPSAPVSPQPRSQPKQVARSHEPGVVKTIGVFEREKFDLCNYRGFSATIDGAGGAVTIASEDRSIPDREFRGYKKTLPVSQPMQLWDGCIVGVGVQTTAPVRRIVFSVLVTGGT